MKYFLNNFLLQDWNLVSVLGLTEDLFGSRCTLIILIPLQEDAMADGKKEFYPKAREAFTAMGYRFYDGDKDFVGKGPSHASKPDYIATKGRMSVIGEIKAPAESPTSSSWRQPQSSDGEAFKRVRLEVAQREVSGKVPKEIGGHEIIIMGQIPDYIEKNGKTYDLPSSIPDGGRILAGYTFPLQERHNVEQALKNCRKAIHEKIDTSNGSVTFIFQA
jgi:hypothetical protein